MSDHRYTIRQLRATLSESQTFLDEAASAEGCLDPIPDWRECSSGTSGVHIEDFSELIDLTELLDAWNRYLLTAALQQCAAAAETGYQKAIAHVTALGAMADQIEAQANRLADAARSDDDAEFKKQIAEIVQTLKDECSRLRHDVDDRRKNLSTFNITLFGRTMTGKSTLMEILTRGNGSSIGKGAQRTTRDVRAYGWKGLTVTDVPGVAAYGGEEDARAAHQAANQADLVLFLISDDAPQKAEAEHLAQLRRSGKQVLGIHNVKSNISNDKWRALFLRDPAKTFDAAKVRAILKQFDEIVRHHIPGHAIEVVNTHLRARYLAGLPQNAGEPWRDNLEHASRFRDVENRILREVTVNGPFLRINSFLNSASTANLQAWESARQSAVLCDQAQGRLKVRMDELRSWQTGFIRRANQRIDQLVQETVGSLRDQIPVFAEQYCEDRSLSDHWNTRVQNTDIDQKCQAVQKQLADECQDYFKQLVVDMQQELTLLENQFSGVSMETGSIANTRRRWNWGVNLTSGGLIAGLSTLAALNIWNPGGWVLAGILGVVGLVGVVGTLMGRLFGNRDQKRREAIANITPELQRNLDGIERQIRDAMSGWLDDFTKQCVNGVEVQFSQLVQSQAGMADLMSDIASQQRETLLAVNRDTAVAALQHLGEFDAAQSVDRVARIPGQALVLTLTGDSNLSADAGSKLGYLLQEQVVCAPDRMSAPAAKYTLKSLDATTSERLVAQLI